MMDRQSEFLFADGTALASQPPDPRTGFYREVEQVWHLPLGQSVRVLLRGHDLSEVSGRLELERAPDLPLNPREPLQLSVGGVAFLSTQVQAWSLIR
jgi:hypothetical protein